MKLITIVMAFFLICCVANAQVSHVYRQIVRNVPDTTGYVWYTYDLYNMASPDDYLDKNSPGSGCAFSAPGQFMRWFADAGNFPEHSWVNGDTVIMIGSWDVAYANNPGTYGENPDHIGYYWLFSDTMDATADPQNWSPDDTLREMPKPLVAQATENDSVYISIPNPMETRRGDQTEYDVAGFWLIADTTGDGTPNSYDVEIGYIPVQGGVDSTTEYVYYPADIIGTPAWMHYHAYHIVVRPETTSTPGVVPGFSTFFSSRNSDYVPDLTHTLTQTVEDALSLVSDTTGIRWVTYDLYNAETHVLDQDASGCSTVVSGTIDWFAAIENFPSWQNGDTVIAFGSWDSAYANDPGSYGSNVNHTGFYWLFSDTLDASQTVQPWSPSDTLRVMPKPIVYKTGLGGGANDTIWVEITNPAETRRGDQPEYDVLGYWIWADTTNTGTPDAFNGASSREIDFVPVQGGPGDVTTYYCLESAIMNINRSRRSYIAYKLVTRPDTSTTGTMGHASYYFSQNPDSTVRVFWNDTTAPVIESTTIWTDTDSAGPFEVFANITDAPAGLDTLRVMYRVGTETAWQFVQMTYTGSGDTYVGTIPAVTGYDKLVRYYVRAVDAWTNAAVDPPEAPTVSYAFIANVLVDTTGPVIDSTTQWEDTSFAGPFEVRTYASDISGVSSVSLHHRIGAGGWNTSYMTNVWQGWWIDSIPAVGEDFVVRYYIRASDSLSNDSFDPEGAPDEYYEFIGNWTGIEEHSEYGFALQFIPLNNPSRGDVHFMLRLPEDMDVRLRIFDCAGRSIATPVNTRMHAGSYDIHVDQQLSAGIYFYSLELPDENRNGKLIVVR